MEYAGVDGNNCSCCAWNCPQIIGKEIVTVENRRRSWEHSNENIVEIDQNAEKSPGDSGESQQTYVSVKDSQGVK